MKISGPARLALGAWLMVGALTIAMLIVAPRG